MATSATGSSLLIGLRFGMASAVISAVVILLSMRPIARFRFTIIAALLTIALVDSLADGYALMNAAANRGGEENAEPRPDVAHSAASAVASIVAKVVVCGSLAALVWLSKAGAGGRRLTVAPWVIYAVAAAFAGAQIVLTAVTTTRSSRLPQMALLAGLFAAAVVLSLLLRRLLDAVAPGPGNQR
jgi:hypothetical protein